MTGEEAAVLALIREVRTAFNRMKALAGRMHADLGVTPSMRAVLEAFVDRPPRTVPDVAREKGVSRQHVQSVVNLLIARGLLVPEANPGHRRSPLLRPTERGARLFARIRAREAEPLARLAASLPAPDLAAATRLLRRMNDELEALEGKGE